MKSSHGRRDDYSDRSRRYGGGGEERAGGNEERKRNYSSASNSSEWRDRDSRNKNRSSEDNENSFSRTAAVESSGEYYQSQVSYIQTTSIPIYYTKDSNVKLEKKF